MCVCLYTKYFHQNEYIEKVKYFFTRNFELRKISPLSKPNLQFMCNFFLDLKHTMYFHPNFSLNEKFLHKTLLNLKRSLPFQENIQNCLKYIYLYEKSFHPNVNLYKKVWNWEWCLSFQGNINRRCVFVCLFTCFCWIICLFVCLLIFIVCFWYCLLFVCFIVFFLLACVFLDTQVSLAPSQSVSPSVGNTFKFLLNAA